MSLHDAYARRTPYELAFPDGATALELAARVEDEARALGVDAHAPGAFLALGAVQAFARGLSGPDAPPGALPQLAALAFHSVHLARAGCPLYLLSTHAARYLVEGAPPGDPAPPTPAGYLQLPRHLFWAELSEGAAPESVDGLFWTATPAGTLHVMLVTGVRPERPGIAVIQLPEAPLADAATWLGAAVREDGPDFGSALPGGDLDGLYAFRAAGEALKLVGRLFAYVQAVPEALEDRLPEAASPPGPTPSSLPFKRVVLHA